MQLAFKLCHGATDICFHCMFLVLAVYINFYTSQAAIRFSSRVSFCYFLAAVAQNGMPLVTEAINTGA